MTGSFVLVLAGAAGGADPSTVEKVITAINVSAPRIDACVARYTEEYPQADGVAQLQVVVDETGKVSEAQASTSLEGARLLRPCLASAAETWKLPPPSKPNATLSVKVRVAKGRRFKLLTPKEQAQAAADAQRRAAEAASKEDEGFVNVGTFLPSGW
ncbi:MAG: hypothetical protein AAF627_05320 [Myxococcota bacterium]